jgi:hypothetical protein
VCATGATMYVNVRFLPVRGNEIMSSRNNVDSSREIEISLYHASNSAVPGGREIFRVSQSSKEQVIEISAQISLHSMIYSTVYPGLILQPSMHIYNRKLMF